jgi:DNA-binding transcriptional LysR family regulator
MEKAPPLSQLDFLLVFEAVLEHKSITKAALKLGISQSALSHALDRLRARFADPLFVRTGAAMMPTPLVLALSDPVRRSMAIIRDEVLAGSRFDPATTTRNFRICVNEVGAFLLVPRIVKELAKFAPRASLAPTVVASAELSGALESGQIDLAVGHFPQLKASVFQQTLFRRRYVAVVREGHPRVGQSLTTEQLLKMPIVRCTPTAEITRWLDRQFAKARRAPIVPLETPYVMPLATLVASTDWLAFMPEELVSVLGKVAGIRTVKLPTAPPALDVKQHWHRRQKDDAANRFLRQLVHTALHEP